MGHHHHHHNIHSLSLSVCADWSLSLALCSVYFTLHFSFFSVQIKSAHLWTQRLVIPYFGATSMDCWWRPLDEKQQVYRSRRVWNHSPLYTPTNTKSKTLVNIGIISLERATTIRPAFNKLNDIWLYYHHHAHRYIHYMWVSPFPQSICRQLKSAAKTNGFIRFIILP